MIFTWRFAKMLLFFKKKGKQQKNKTKAIEIIRKNSKNLKKLNKIHFNEFIRNV